MSNIKATTYSPAVCLARLRIDESLLRLDNRTRLALVVDAKHLASDLKLATLTRNGDWLQEFEFALAVEDVLGVELRYAVDGLGIGAGVKVDHFLVSVFEGQNNGVCREGGELGVQFLERLLI